jgi:hypothetical protein
MFWHLPLKNKSLSRFILLLLILFVGFEQKAFAEDVDQAMANCLFNSVQTQYSELFSPATQTTQLEVETGRFAFVRLYPSNSYQSGLAIYQGSVFYSFYNDWKYFSEFGYANNLLASGKCTKQDITVTSQANVLTKAKWDNPVINVCWENATSTNEYYRNLVRDAVENTWDKVSGVDFIGWGQCLTNSKGIRIVFKDAPNDNWPHTKGLGKQIDGMPEGMLLNYEFNNWVGGSGCRNQRDFCVKAIAVHEFGHALGFAHEQARQDTPSWCTETQQGGEIDGDMYIGSWDANSIMNYCNPMYNNGGNLSETDILAVQKIYGLPNAPISCNYSISPSQVNVRASGQNGLSVSITTQSNCSWTASSNVNWITLLNATSGNNSGQISYNVADNANTSSRTGTITIADQTFTVTQTGKAISTPKLKVTYPNGGESLTAGNTYTITWDKAGAQTSTVIIYLYKGNNYVWSNSNPVSNTGSTLITFPSSLVVGSDYRVGVQDYSGSSNFDFSDNYFTVSAAIPTTFNATLKKVEYDYNSAVCPAGYKVLVRLVFDAQGVNQSDLMYVEEQPTPGYEQKTTITTSGIVREFCSVPNWKTSLSFHLKEISTNRVSNLITTNVDTTITSIISNNTPLEISISGQLNSITIRETSGTGDSGNYSISGMYQNRTFYVPLGKKVQLYISGQLNDIYVSSSLFENVTIIGSGQLNDMVRI